MILIFSHKDNKQSPKWQKIPQVKPPLHTSNYVSLDTEKSFLAALWHETDYCLFSSVASSQKKYKY